MKVLAWVMAGYGVMSVIAFIAYAWDKRAAQRGGRRTPEVTLHLLEFLGGWPGAFLAQQLIRHKNAKVGYQLVFWSIILLHLVAGWFIINRWG